MIKRGIFLIICFGLALSINFDYQLEPTKMICFGDSLASMINVQTKIRSAETTGLIVKYYEAQGKVIYKRNLTMDKGNSHFAFTTEMDGNVNFCFANKGEEIASFTFEYLTGVDAKDYSGLTTKKEIQPLEIQTIKMKEIINSIKKEMKFVVRKEGRRMLHAEDIGYKILGVSLITLLSIVLLSMFQITYLKEFF